MAASQDASGYVYENVGLTLTPSPVATGYVYENVAFGTGRVRYPWSEAADGTTTPALRY